ncbi:MAG: S41 family peptidase [Pyrinomonadaceae bacterium]
MKCAGVADATHPPASADMRYRSMKMVLVGLVLLVVMSSCSSQNTTTQLSSQAWRQDLRYLARELPSHHTNAFHTVSRETFDAEVARLDAAIPSMNGDEVTVGFMRIVSLVGDGHTHLDLPPPLLRYPIEVEWFGEELRIVAAKEPDHAAVGARVVAIGSTSIGEVLERATQLVPRGENEGRTRFAATMHLTSPEVLHGLAVITDRGSAPFALELTSGELATVTFSPAPFGEFSAWRLATGDKPPLYLQRLTERWWTEFLPATKTVYFSFTRYPSDAEFQERAVALGRMIDESQARRLVIDLRRNGGGNLDQFRRLLLPIIKSRPTINRHGGLFVITGPGTFSAATVNALDMRNEANAILVGAATGMRPTHYGEHGEFRLPNSGFRISYSTRHYRFGAENDSAVLPDRRIEPTWAEFRAGRDPVMEWILSTTNE